MSEQFGFYDFVELHSQHLHGVGAKEGGHGSAPPGGGPPGSGLAPYLETTGKDCGEEQTEEAKYELHAVGCRSWFCPRCCVGRGLALRRRLIEVVGTFSGLLMWTFTVDPKLFASPVDAFHYVRDKRCVGEMMKKLRKLGHLHSGRYFCVTEWQKETQMAHYHVLLDASHVPFDEVCEVWNSFRPESAGPVEGDRPGFGSIRFSKRKFKSGVHAARYACKYLIKFPEHGYPDWVLDHDGKKQVHRYSTSHRFWAETEEEGLTPEELDEELAADAQEEAGTDDDSDELDEPAATIRQRVAKCGSKSVVLRISETVDETTGALAIRKSFVCRLDEAFDSIVLRLHKSSEGKRRLTICQAELFGVTRKARVGFDAGALDSMLNDSRRPA